MVKDIQPFHIIHKDFDFDYPIHVVYKGVSSRFWTANGVLAVIIVVLFTSPSRP